MEPKSIFDTFLQIQKSGKDVAGSSLSGYDAFSIDYEPQWPFSIVIDSSVRDKYRYLFRCIFQWKIIERKVHFSFLMLAN